MRIHAVSTVSPWWSIWSMTNSVHEWTGTLSLWNKADKAMNAHSIPPEGSGKSFRSLMNASLHWICWIMNFHVLIPGLCGLQKNGSGANAVQDDLTGAGGLTQPSENKIFFLVPQNKTKELNYQNQIRKSVQNLFSAGALIQHADNLTWHRTQRQSSLIGSCCALFIVHALCSGAAQVILRLETRAFEDEPTKYEKRKETEVKMNFSFTWIWMLPSLMLRQ